MNGRGYEQYSDAKERRQSAITLVKLLLNGPPELLSKHREEALSWALWKVTEAETGKHRTQYRSKASESASSKQLRHDHVFQRAVMVRDLLREPERVDEILRKAVGCTITKEEHRELDRFKDLDGWDRYKQAMIDVIDMKTGSPFDFSQPHAPELLHSS